MHPEMNFEKCLNFINWQLQPGLAGSGLPFIGHAPTITISRQSGSGGHSVGERLLALLRPNSEPGGPPWELFDRNLTQKVLAEHHLPQRLARFMTEDHISEINDTLDELFGLHPPSWTMVRQTADTILRLAEAGNVVLIGRAANVITARLPYAFHVRLVGSLDRRIARIQELEHLSPKQARAFVLREDRGRARYLRKYFSRDIDDPMLYHLVLNTDALTVEEAARIIASTVLSRATQPDAAPAHTEALESSHAA